MAIGPAWEATASPDDAYVDYQTADQLIRDLIYLRGQWRTILYGWWILSTASAVFGAAEILGFI